MGEPEPPGQTEPAPPDRLDSWKEIAAFFGRGVTTVQRWEEEEGLPVHRHSHAKRGTVYAFRSELTRWHVGRALAPTAAEVPADVATGLDESATRESVRAATYIETETSPAEGATATAVGRTRTLVLPALGLVATLALGWFGASALGPASERITSESPVSRSLANDDAYEAYPTLSPDGKEVAYRWSRDDAPGIYIKPTDTGMPRLLEIDGPSPPGRRDTFPKWSPDGRRIAFLRELGSSVWDVRVVSSSGGASRHVTKITSGSVSWLPDSATLAVADRPASGEPYSVFLVSVDTGQRFRRVTSPPPGSFGDWHCAVSPDGTRLAVARFRSGSDADVYVTTLADGEPGLTQLTHDSVGLGHLNWTPDGRTLVFASERADRSAIWEIPAAPGGSPKLVAGGEGGAHHPSMARTFEGDAVKLAFQHESAQVALWRWDLGTSPRPEPRAIAPTETSSDRHPAWSPDGQHIAFSSIRTGNAELWVSDADGTNARQVTLQSGLGVSQPRWSPGGDWILFTAIRGGQQDIYKVRVDGTDVIRVTYDSTDERNGSWSRDGRWIYFRSNRSGEVRVWRTEANRRVEPELATASESSEAIESLDGTRLFFTKHYDAGLWEKPLPDGPESLLVPDWHAREGLWDVIQNGILMIDKQVTGSQVDQPLTLFEFATKRLVPFATLPVIVARTQDGISARPDGALLWSQKQLYFSDLRLFDRWRPSTSSGPR